VSSGRLDRTVPDREHRQLLQDLRRPRSYLLLPLVVNAHQLGSMLLVTTEAWQLDAEDVQLAVDVAQRCAAVIDKARLITELARANKVLHELRSTSVLLASRPRGRRRSSGWQRYGGTTYSTPRRTAPSTASRHWPRGFSVGWVHLRPAHGGALAVGG